MGQLIRLFAQIALLRRGPQDLPASPLLLTLTVTGYFLINFIVSYFLPPFQGPWLGPLGVDVIFLFAWYALLMSFTKRPERFLQTTTAVYGYQAVLSPVWLTAVWLVRRFEQDSFWQYPTTLLSVTLLIWLIAANSHIVKAALEWSMAPSVALVILQTLAGEMLMVAIYPLPNSTL